MIFPHVSISATSPNSNQPTNVYEQQGRLNGVKNNKRYIPTHVYTFDSSVLFHLDCCVFRFTYEIMLFGETLRKRPCMVKIWPRSANDELGVLSPFTSKKGANYL
jgi:hypothetical protein